MAFNFTPTIWSRLIAKALRNNLVAKVLINNHWEGEIKEVGNAVKIFCPGAINVSDYDKNTDLGDPQVPNDGDETLTITQSKSFHFYIDDIDSIQQPGKVLDAYMDNATFAIADTADRYILSHFTGVHAHTTYTPGAQLTADNVFDAFEQIGLMLNEQKVPAVGRAAVISHRVKMVINQYLARKNTALGDVATTDGYVGNFAGFAIHVSNNITVVNEDVSANHTGTEVVHKCLFGTNLGITFAEQVPPHKISSYRPEKRFGEAFKGLALYGGKMVYDGKANALLNAWFEE